MVTAFVNEIETNFQKLLWVRKTAKRLSNRCKATETEGLVYLKLCIKSLHVFIID